MMSDQYILILLIFGGCIIFLLRIAATLWPVSSFVKNIFGLITGIIGTSSMVLVGCYLFSLEEYTLGTGEVVAKEFGYFVGIALMLGGCFFFYCSILALLKIFRKQNN